MRKRSLFVMLAVVFLLGAVGMAGAQIACPQMLLPGNNIPKFVSHSRWQDRYRLSTPQKAKIQYTHEGIPGTDPPTFSAGPAPFNPPGSGAT